MCCRNWRGRPPGLSLAIPPEIRLEVDIAAGERIDSRMLRNIADPVPLTCPSCAGVLSEIRGAGPLRFRCQVGHNYTADVLARLQEEKVDEALRVALRIIEERAELVARMADDGRQSGRRAVAEMYEDRAKGVPDATPTRSGRRCCFPSTARRRMRRTIDPAGPPSNG